MNANEKLSPFHIAILVFMSQAGIVVFSLPSTLATHFGTNGWLFLLVCLVISTFNIYLIGLAYRLGKGQNVFQILESTISKVLLYPAYIGVSAIWIIFGCMIGKKYVLLFQMIAFPTTNPMVLKIGVDLLAYLLLIKGIYNISKAATIFFWMIIWMFPLLLLFIPEFQSVRLTPFIFKGGHDMLKGGFDIYTAFLGYELSILFFPYMEQRKKSIWGMYAGNAFLTLNYVCLSFTCFGFFSLLQLKNLLYPLIDLLAFIRFPFIERLENLLYGFFLFMILLTLVMYLWAAQEALVRITRKARSKGYVAIILLITYCTAYIPKTTDQVNVWITNLSYVVTFIGFALPIVVIIVLLFQRKGEKSHA